jgi:hypothetical protein
MSLVANEVEHGQTLPRRSGTIALAAPRPPLYEAAYRYSNLIAAITALN